MATYHVNVGDVNAELQETYGGNRSWVDCRRFGFISAGQHQKYSRCLMKLKIGDVVYAYLNKHGYVGFGEIIAEARMAKDVQLEDGPLLEQAIRGTFLTKNSDDPTLCEYVVRINWFKTCDRGNAVHFDSAPRNLVCNLADTERLAILRQRFGPCLPRDVASPDSGKPPLAPHVKNNATISLKKTTSSEAAHLLDSTSFQRNWLDYSWSVLTDQSHIDACKQSGGRGIDDASLRWPGCLGRLYMPGGLLLIANIHREFASGHASAELAARLVACTKKWRDGGRSASADAEYLWTNRACYLEGLESWKVGTWYEKFLKMAGLQFEHVTYLNAARCQALEGACPQLQKLCLKRFPISHLVDILRPNLILTCSTEVLRTQIDVPVRWFNQRNGLDEQKRKFGIWSTEALAELKSRAPK
jgi:hypothetical protein